MCDKDFINRISQKNKIFLFLFLTYLTCEIVRSQSCQQIPSSYDLLAQSCIKCDQSCESCFGTSKNQCTKCKSGFFYQPQENLCVEKCENIFYQDYSSMVCIKCSIPGCMKCDINNKCSECQQNLVLQSNGLCYQKEQMCESSQQYDYRLGKCVQYCENNAIENQKSKICQNLSNCNIVNEYQSYQIKKFVDRVAVLSNQNLLLYEFPCRFYLADKNLQIIQFLELMGEKQFYIKAIPTEVFISQNDIAGCSGFNQIILYDFVKEQYIIKMDLVFPQTVILSAVLFNINAIFFISKDITQQNSYLDLITKKQVNIIQKETRKIYTINQKKRMFIQYSEENEKVIKFRFLNNLFNFLILNNQFPQFTNSLSLFIVLQICLCFYHQILLFLYFIFIQIFQCIYYQQSFIYQILSDGSCQQYPVSIGSFNLAYIANDELEIFACFAFSILQIYKINQGDTFTVIPLFSISSIFFFANEVLFLPTLNCLLVSFIAEKYLNVYKISQDWKSYTQQSQITSTVYISLNGLQIINSNIDKQYIMIRDLIQYCFIPLDINSFQQSTQEINKFQCASYSFLGSSIIYNVFLIEKQLSIFYKQSFTSQVVQVYNTQIDNQLQTHEYKTTEGYTNYLETLSGSFVSTPKLNIQQQNTLSLTEQRLKKSSLIFIDNQLPLSYYQNNIQFRNIWFSEKFFGESDKIIEYYGFLLLQNSQNLYYVQYQTDQLVYKFLIFDMSSQKVIIKKEISSYFYNMLNQMNYNTPQIIQKYNYILFGNFNFLYDLSTNAQINSFATDLTSNRYFYSLSIEDKIMIIDNDKMIVKFYDLISNTYTQIFQDENSYYIQFIMQNSDQGQVQLQNNQYLYFLFDLEKILAFSLSTKTFSQYNINIIDYHDLIGVSFFQGTQNNELFLFTAAKIFQFTYDLQVTVVYQFPSQNKSILYYVKCDNKYIISANAQVLYKFDLQTKEIQSLQTQANSSNISSYLKLRFFGQQNEFVMYNNVLINHQQMKIVYNYAPNVDIVGLINVQTETDSFTSHIDTFILDIFFIRNLEKYPAYSYNLGSSQSKIIYKNHIKYIIYYYDSTSQKIIKQDLLNPISKTDYPFNHSFDLIVVDTILDIFIFSSQDKNVYIFNPKEQTSQIKLIKTYETIAKLDICENMQTIIIEANKQKMYTIQIQLYKNIIIYKKYLKSISIEVKFPSSNFLNDLQYFVKCDKKLIVVYSPILDEYLIDSGEQNPNNAFIQAQLKYNEFNCIPFYDIDNKILIFPNSAYIQYIIIKDRISLDAFSYFQTGVTDLNFDYNLNLVIIIEGKLKSITIIDGFTSKVKYLSNTPNIFSNDNYQIDSKTNQIFILDASPFLVIYNYQNNQQTSKLLDYIKLNGFKIDIDKKFIFFYDSNNVYIHKLTSFEFIGSISDPKYSNSIIKEVYLDIILNTLIVYKDTQAVLIYDLNQIAYTEPLYQTQYLEIQSLKFDQDLYLVYNVRNRALSLFQVNTFKDIYTVAQTDSSLLKLANFIKISSNQFIYLNVDFILYGSIDTSFQKIVKICENYNSISIKDLYFNKNLYTLILIENYVDNIYILDLKELQQSKKFNYILKVTNNNQYKFFRGFIQYQQIIFYKDTKIYSYNIENSGINQKNLGQNNISLIIKLSPPNTETDILNSNNNYILDYLNTNESDKQNSNILVIINNDKKIKILESSSLSELYTVQVDYLILNVYVERSRSLIFIVGSGGKTHLFNYELKKLASLANPCLFQTKIQSDNFYIYLFCEKQLDIYNRITLSKIFPTQIIENTLNKIIYTQQNNIFILVSNKKIQVAIISKISSFQNILFEKSQQLLQILSYKFSFDINYTRYLEIVGLGMTDIVYYNVALESASVCTHSYESSNSQMLNNFNQNIIQLNMAYSNQQLKELRILYKQNQTLQPPPIYGSTSSEGLKINVYSTKSLQNINESTIYWTDSTIFDNSAISSLQINSFNLIIHSDSSFILNLQKNMNNLQIYDINILQISHPVTIQNYKKIFIQNISFNQFQQSFSNDLLTFINCEEIFIDNIEIIESQFTAAYVFKFINSNQISIKNVNINNSQLQSFLSFSQVQQVTIDSLEITNLSIQSNLIDQINIINTQFYHIQFNKLKGGTFLKQLGCEQLTFEVFSIINSQSLVILEVLEYVKVVVYQSLYILIKNLIIQNSDEIQFNLSSDKIDIEDFFINNALIGKQNLFNINTKQINLNNVNLNEIQSETNNFIFQIINFTRLKLMNSKFTKNSIQLIELINQFKGNIIFESVQILDNSCQESLIQISQSSQLELIDSQFKSNTGKKNGGVFSIQSMNIFKIQNSLFQKNTSTEGKGGALYLYDILQTSIENSTFIDNESINDNGGSLYYFSSDKIQLCAQFLINKNSVFKQNKASTGKGGAIFLSKVNLQLENAKIIENSAAIGGGIFYEVVVPDIILNTEQRKLNEISNNKAIFFGQNIGSTLRQMQFIPIIQNENSYQFSKQSQMNVFEIQNFQSGQYMQLSKINLLDEETNQLDLKLINNESLNNLVQKELESINLSIHNINSKEQIIFQGGVLSKYSENGFSFNISLNYQPSSKSSFQISSNIINGLKYPDGQYYIKESQLSLEFQVQFRKCALGEIRVGVLESIICEKCPDGKYSLNQNDTLCTQCPITAKSCQGSQIIMKEGYWRKNQYTDTIVQCSKQLISCQPQNLESKFGCSEGYIGPLCEQCDYEGAVWEERYSYSFSAKQFCSKCSSNIFYFTINIVLFFLFQFIQIVFAIYRITGQVERYLTIYYMKVLGLLYLSNSENSTENPVHQKILIDHLQIISIANSFNLQLPTFFNYGSDVVGNPLQISSIAFDCFYSLELNKIIPYWFFKFVWSILLPILIILSYLLFNKIKALLKLNHNNSRYNSTAVIYIYLFYFPSMITLISKSINCRKIGDESYSQIDITISCREYDQHGKYIYFCVLPFAIIFAIILPIILFLKIRKERQNKISRITQSKYKFLYEVFEENLYFWEILRLGFKSCIMIASILLYEFLIIKACTISSILIAYYSLQMKFKPYKQAQINYLESQSTLICILSINLCLLYQQIVELNQILSQFTTVVLYLANIYFVLKLLLFIFLKPIPVEKEKRNFFQNYLFRMKQRFPESLHFITVQLKVSMKALLKIKILKQNIKLLAQYRGERIKNENTKFKKTIVKLIKNSSLHNSQVPPRSRNLILEDDDNGIYAKSTKNINNEALPTELGQLNLLQSRYLTRNPTYRKRSEFQLLKTEEFDKSLLPPSPKLFNHSQFKTSSISLNQQTFVTEDQGDHIVEQIIP